MVPGMTDDFAALLERGRTGDKRAVARLISLIEQGGETARSVLTQLWPHTGRARIFGITGPPGAGKSTLTNALTKCWRAKGLRVGIIAVDPTSPFTGGAILGDRVRMGDLTLDTGVFIRSMGTRGQLGGLSPATAGAVHALDACGYDLILLETVGVGQSEVAVMEIADLVLVLNVPGLATCSRSTRRIGPARIERPMSCGPCWSWERRRSARCQCSWSRPLRARV